MSWDKLIEASERELLRDIRVSLASLVTITKQGNALLAAILDAQNLQSAEEPKKHKGKK